MSDYGYGLWALVAFNSLLFIVFAVSFLHPRSSRDWRVMGGFSAFVVALFTGLAGVCRGNAAFPAPSRRQHPPTAAGTSGLGRS